MSQLVKLGSLWKVENPKDNSPLLTGSMGNAKLVIFPNKYKGEGKNRPDYVLYVSNREKKEADLPTIQRNENFSGNAPMGQEPPPADEPPLPF